MDARTLRAALETFLGEQRFIKFITAGFEPRMFYWQEREWDRFVDAHPQFAAALPRLADLLRFCLLHRQDLQPDHVRVIHATVYYVRDSGERSASLFPHASLGPYYTQGVPHPEPMHAVWYCPTCRELARADEASASGIQDC